MQLWTTVLYEGSYQGSIFIEADSWYDAREICRTQHQDIADAFWLTLKPVTSDEVQALNPDGAYRIAYRDERRDIQERITNPAKVESKRAKKRKK